jgi:hypothetical protein
MDSNVLQIWNLLLCLHFSVTVKTLKQSHHRPWQVLRVPWGWDSQILRQSAHESGKVFSPTHRSPLPPGNIPVTHFCYRLSRPFGNSIQLFNATQCGPKCLGLIFLKFEDTWGRNLTFFKFKISSVGIYTGFCAVVQFLKSCRKFLFLDLLLLIGYGLLDLSNIRKVEFF